MAKIDKIKNKIKRDKSTWYLVIPVFIMVMLAGIAMGNRGNLFSLSGDKAANSVRPVELSFSDVLRRADEIKTMNIRGADATGTLDDGTKYTATITYDPELLEKIAAGGASISIDSTRSFMDRAAFWVPILFWLFFFWFIFRGMGRGVGRSIAAQNPTKIMTGNSKKTTFKDVAGIDAEKQELMEIVDFLKNKDKFRALGARVPRGVLLSGEPGTGKTLLARAIAGEANVPFFAASGSDFSGIIVGLGVAKIKEMFEMAKRNAPCILFIDEIDAIGQKRSTQIHNDQDREQTLNQLLIEMDGFANNTGIIVLGATNRVDMLDPALLRPGRFDRQVYIELPDLAGRKQILDLYAGRVKLASDVDLMDVARGTTGFSGADLENLLNEAALHAVRVGHAEITNTDMDEARDKIMMGPRKVRKIRDDDKKLTAFHEAGHAFVSQHYAGITDPIHKATIIPRGRALGMVQHLPVDDKVSMTIAEVRAQLAISLAGRVAEEIFFGSDKITTGAESDIAGATRLARYSITTAGLSKKIGPVAVNQSNTWGGRSALENASEKTAELVDVELRSWMDAAHADAVKILTQNRKTVERLADELLKRETLTGDEISEIIAGKKTSKKQATKSVAKPTPKKKTVAKK